jgi:NADH:ubiquinone oxidoreductase subunit 6 (subunit J)
VLPLLLIALVTLTAAAVAMALRNLIHSALLLIASWAGVAAFYLWAGAEFAAFAQVLVYVGAVSMVVLFAMLLTRRSLAELAVPRGAAGRTLAALVTGGAVFALLVKAVLAMTPQAMPATAAAPAVTVREIGLRLMGAHAVSLLVVGVLLTVALLGAVVIAAQDRDDVGAWLAHALPGRRGRATPLQKPGDRP